MSVHPEVAVVTRWGPDHGLVLSFVSHLLEHGIHFAQGENQSLFSEIPEDLKRYRMLVIDAPALEHFLADASTRRRLETWVGAGGAVSRLENPIVGSIASKLYTDSVYDFYNYACVQEWLVTAGLTRYSDDAYHVQRERSDSAVIEGLVARVARWVTAKVWDEMTLHFYKSLKRLIEVGGREDLREPFLAGIRANSEKIPSIGHHDTCAGYFAPTWLYEQTGEREHMETVRQRLDEMIARRPRHMGVLTGSGFVDDPLAPGKHYANAVLWPDTIWTDGMHMYSAAFAAMSRVTGDPRYLDEMIAHADHIINYNQREDGLICECSTHGRGNNQAWSRAMSHALMGFCYTMEEMDRAHPAWERMRRSIDKALNGLLIHQHPRLGLWRNLVDHPDARPESSGTCCFAYVMGRGINDGWLDRDKYEPALRAAWQGIKRMYWRNGMCANCRGSGAAQDAAYYIGRPQGYSSTVPAWALMAALEVQRLR